MATAVDRRRRSPAMLRLKHGARSWCSTSRTSSIVLGRDASCQIVVADRKASRHHARIERRRDKFFLVDQSTNGTYVDVRRARPRSRCAARK